MKRNGLMLLLTVLIGCSGIIAGENTILTPSAEQQMLLSGMKFGKYQTWSDTVDFNYEKSPGLAFMMSVIIPGTGELYAGAIKRGIAFLGTEAIFWGGYFNRKNKGETMEKDYKEFADVNWSLDGYLENYLAYEDYFSTRASHHIFVAYGDQESPLDLVNIDTMAANLDISNLSAFTLRQQVIDGEVVPIKDRDYYENIGKYTQFAGGWGDFNDTSLVVTPYRDDYLTQRKESNDALKMATNFATMIMFNHLFSALHAQIAAKQYHSEGEEVSWNLGLVTDVRYRKFVLGVRLSWAF